MEKTLDTFQKAIEEEIKSFEETILNNKWDEKNHKTLLNLCRMLEEHKTTLKHIKQHKRGFI